MTTTKQQARTWKNGEFVYCADLVCGQGDDNVGRDPKNVAAYLRLQASDAFRDREFELAARLGHAAMAINCDARNNHAPDWTRARRVLEKALDQRERYLDATQGA